MTWIYNASVVILGVGMMAIGAAGFAGLRPMGRGQLVFLALCVLTCAKSGGPGPLEVIAAQWPGNVHRFPGNEQAGRLHRLHRLGRKAGGVHPPVAVGVGLPPSGAEIRQTALGVAWQ